MANSSTHGDHLHSGRGIPLPRLIQAGMGARISGARLANTTARLGAVGVVSSVGLRHIIAEEIRAGNPEAIEIASTFPIPCYVDELLNFAPDCAWHKRPIPMDSPDPRKSELPKRLSAICAYIEVVRAKRGHNGWVGINIMWKCALTALPSIYGAMLAGVDVLLCGAGVPMELPDIVHRIRAGEDLRYAPLSGTDMNVHMNIAADGTSAYLQSFDKPLLFPILSNFAFPKRILDVWGREHDGLKPDAFVLENHRAGGHNAPPRNKESFEDADSIEAYFDKVVGLTVPVYVAGAGSTRDRFEHWIDRGAYGIQVGSRFALCRESGMRGDLRERIVRKNIGGRGEVLTSNRISSTGYPFKFVPLPGTLSEDVVYEKRKRICNKGYLLQSRREVREDGTVNEVYICPAMPLAQYTKLGGDIEDTHGRVCLCNSLLATAGIGDAGEPPLVTLGEDGLNVKKLLTARDIVEDILTPDHVARVERYIADTVETEKAAALV